METKTSVSSEAHSKNVITTAAFAVQAHQLRQFIAPALAVRKLEERRNRAIALKMNQSGLWYRIVDGAHTTLVEHRFPARDMMSYHMSGPEEIEFEVYVEDFEKFLKPFKKNTIHIGVTFNGKEGEIGVTDGAMRCVHSILETVDVTPKLPKIDPDAFSIMEYEIKPLAIFLRQVGRDDAYARFQTTDRSLKVTVCESDGKIIAENKFNALGAVQQRNVTSHYSVNNLIAMLWGLPAEEVTLHVGHDWPLVTKWDFLSGTGTGMLAPRILEE